MVAQRTCFAGLAFAAMISVARPQQPTPRPAYDGSGAPDVALQIRINEDCRIVPDLAHPFPGKKPRPFRDDAICHIESPNESEHLEERIQGNQLLRYAVRVSEATYVLQNITQDHIVFLVERPVPNGWTIDSTPEPNRYDGSTAIFPVHAQPGEIVSLHVGMRRSTTLKPKIIAN